METRKRQRETDSPDVIPEFTRRDKRVAIFVQFRLGDSTQECSEKLQRALGEQAPSLTTIREWYVRFQTGHTSFEDDPREGRPHSSNIQKNVDLVKHHLGEDRRVTVRELVRLTGISHGTVETILKQELHLKKVCARWIPHLLKENEKAARIEFCRYMLQKFDEGRSELVGNILTGDETWIYFYDPEMKEQSRQWVAEFEDLPVKISKEKSIGKVMVAIFFRRNGILPPVELEEGSTVTANWYSNICLPKVLENLSKERPRARDRNIFLHHDNAPAHRAQLTQNFLQSTNLEILPHPPYSPDLAPCDFFLFPKMKKNLKGRHFGNREELLNALDEELKRFTPDDMRACFSQWFERMKKCIAKKGCYFEKL